MVRQGWEGGVALGEADICRKSVVPLLVRAGWDDDSSLDRRSIDGRGHFETLLRRDAEFAIGLATHTLAKAPFRLG